MPPVVLMRRVRSGDDVPVPHERRDGAGDGVDAAAARDPVQPDVPRVPGFVDLRVERHCEATSGWS
jgi:hypothetical protein